MIDWKRKLSSRKFWAAVADFLGMILIACHVADTTATQVTAIIMAGGGLIAYIIGEAVADSSHDTVTLDLFKDDDECQDEAEDP